MFLKTVTCTPSLDPNLQTRLVSTMAILCTDGIPVTLLVWTLDLAIQISEDYFEIQVIRTY